MSAHVFHRPRERQVGTRNAYSRRERLIRAANRVHTRMTQLEERVPIVSRRSPELRARIAQLHEWCQWCILEQQEIARLYQVVHADQRRPSSRS